MSAEALIVATEAVGGAKPAMSAAQIAVARVADANAGHSFQVALTRVSETDVARNHANSGPRPVVETAALEQSPANQSYEFALHPVGDNQTLQRRLVDYLNGFSSRAASYPIGINEMVQNPAGSDGASPGSSSGGTDAVVSADGGMTTEGALNMMKRTFHFAIEVEMVAGATTKGTKAANDLMKGQ